MKELENTVKLKTARSAPDNQFEEIKSSFKEFAEQYFTSSEKKDVSVDINDESKSKIQNTASQIFAALKEFNSFQNSEVKLDNFLANLKEKIRKDKIKLRTDMSISKEILNAKSPNNIPVKSSVKQASRKGRNL